MKLCRECYAVLPEPSEKGHRRRKFCNDACKQRFYRKHRSERKQLQHTPFWQEQAEFWRSRCDELQAKLDKEQKYGDTLEKALASLQEKQDWLEARLSAVEGMLRIEPISPEGERILQKAEKELDADFKRNMQEFRRELDALSQEMRDLLHTALYGPE